MMQNLSWANHVMASNRWRFMLGQRFVKNEKTQGRKNEKSSHYRLLYGFLCFLVFIRLSPSSSIVEWRAREWMEDGCLFQLSQSLQCCSTYYQALLAAESLSGFDQVPLSISDSKSKDKINRKSVTKFCDTTRLTFHSSRVNPFPRCLGSASGERHKWTYLSQCFKIFQLAYESLTWTAMSL